MHAGFDELRRAYEGFEEDSSFVSRETLENYRDAALERSRHQAAAIAARAIQRGPVLEVGSGNGRLLIALASHGFDAGLGIDLSASRVAFARRWADGLGLGELKFESGDALSVPIAGRDYAVAACITGAFGYFGAAVPGGDRRVLERLRDALRPEGLLCLELYTKAPLRRLMEAASGAVRYWIELPEPDPWRFYLSEYELEPSGPTLTHRKTFVAREDGSVDGGRVERLRLFDPNAISELLADVGGFADVQLLGDWAGAPYETGDVLIVFARRSGRRGP